jgi:hypothetical protein
VKNRRGELTDNFWTENTTADGLIPQGDSRARRNTASFGPRVNLTPGTEFRPDERRKTKRAWRRLSTDISFPALFKLMRMVGIAGNMYFLT